MTNVMITDGTPLRKTKTPLITSESLRAASPNSVDRMWTAYISGCDDLTDGYAIL